MTFLFRMISEIILQEHAFFVIELYRYEREAIDFFMSSVSSNRRIPKV